MVSISYSVMHAAAEECAAGRLDPADAANVIAATLLAACTRCHELADFPVEVRSAAG